MDGSKKSEGVEAVASRRVWRSLAVVFVVTVIAVPFALINSSFSMLGQGTDETLHTLLRVSALLGFSFLFLQIVTGAFRPALRRVFKPRTRYRAHTAFGLAGLAFIVCHFVFLIPSLGEHWAKLNHGFFVLGPIMLFVLLLTISTALVLRRLLPGAWNRLHILNYVVFTVAAIHALGIGTQTTMLATRLIFAAYLMAAVAGLAYRASSPSWRSKFLPAPVRVRAPRG